MVHEGEKSFECDLGESKFTQKESLKAHIASVHEEEKLFQQPLSTTNKQICFTKIFLDSN